MIKIVHKGKAPKDIPLEATCQNCMSIMSFMAADVKSITDNRDGDYFEFVCPVCSDVIRKSKQ